MNMFIKCGLVVVALSSSITGVSAHEYSADTVETYLAENVPNGAMMTLDADPLKSGWFHLDGMDMYSQGSSFAVQNGTCKFGADWYEHSRIKDGTSAYFTVSNGRATILPPAGESREKGYLNPWNDRVKKISCISDDPNIYVTVQIYEDVNYGGDVLDITVIP